MDEDRKKYLESQQEYLGLNSIEDVEKVNLILEELENYGERGKKLSVYLTSILSGNEGTRAIIPENQLNAYVSLFNGLTENERGE